MNNKNQMDVNKMAFYLMRKLLFGFLLLLVIINLSSATSLTFGPGIRGISHDFQVYDHTSGTYLTVADKTGIQATMSNEPVVDFQVYDRISEKWFNVTDDDLMQANAWVDETGGIPLISSPYSGKAYGLQLTVTAGDDDYLDCIPLTGMVAIEPSGYVELPSGSGNKFWSTAYGPNAGDDGMDEHTYMYNNGWNPAKLWHLMGK